MEDILTLLLAIFVLGIYLHYSKKDFANWNQLDALEKFHLLRFPLFAFVGVVILLIKICFDL
jgi:hypothetical protein